MQKQQYIYYVGWLREHFLKLYWCKKFFYKMDLKCLEKIDKAYSRPGEIPPRQSKNVEISYGNRLQFWFLFSRKKIL